MDANTVIACGAAPSPCSDTMETPSESLARSPPDAPPTASALSVLDPSHIGFEFTVSSFCRDFLHNIGVQLRWAIDVGSATPLTSGRGSTVAVVVDNRTDLISGRLFANIILAARAWLPIQLTNSELNTLRAAVRCDPSVSAAKTWATLVPVLDTTFDLYISDELLLDLERGTQSDGTEPELLSLLEDLCQNGAQLIVFPVDPPTPDDSVVMFDDDGFDEAASLWSPEKYMSSIVSTAPPETPGLFGDAALRNYCDASILTPDLVSAHRPFSAVSTASSVYPLSARRVVPIGHNVAVPAPIRIDSAHVTSSHATVGDVGKDSLLSLMFPPGCPHGHFASLTLPQLRLLVSANTADDSPQTLMVVGMFTCLESSVQSVVRERLCEWKDAGSVTALFVVLQCGALSTSPIVATSACSAMNSVLESVFDPACDSPGAVALAWFVWSWCTGITDCPASLLQRLQAYEDASEYMISRNKALLLASATLLHPVVLSWSVLAPRWLPAVVPCLFELDPLPFIRECWTGKPALVRPSPLSTDSGVKTCNSPLPPRAPKPASRQSSATHRKRVGIRASLVDPVVFSTISFAVCRMATLPVDDISGTTASAMCDCASDIVRAATKVASDSEQASDPTTSLVATQLPFAVATIGWRVNQDASVLRLVCEKMAAFASAVPSGRSRAVLDGLLSIVHDCREGVGHVVGGVATSLILAVLCGENCLELFGAVSGALPTDVYGQFGRSCLDSLAAQEYLLCKLDDTAVPPVISLCEWCLLHRRWPLQATDLGLLSRFMARCIRNGIVVTSLLQSVVTCVRTDVQGLPDKMKYCGFRDDTPCRTGAHRWKATDDQAPSKPLCCCALHSVVLHHCPVGEALIDAVGTVANACMETLLSVDASKTTLSILCADVVTKDVVSVCVARWMLSYVWEHRVVLASAESHKPVMDALLACGCTLTAHVDAVRGYTVVSIGPSVPLILFPRTPDAMPTPGEMARSMTTGKLVQRSIRRKLAASTVEIRLKVGSPRGAPVTSTAAVIHLRPPLRSPRANVEVPVLPPPAPQQLTKELEMLITKLNPAVVPHPPIHPRAPARVNTKSSSFMVSPRLKLATKRGSMHSLQGVDKPVGHTGGLVVCGSSLKSSTTNLHIGKTSSLPGGGRLVKGEKF